MKRAVFSFLATALLLLLSGPASSAGSATGTPEPGGTIIPTTMLLPSPGELINAMDNLGEIDWLSSAAFNSRYDYDNNLTRAMNLGIRATNGFMALQMHDRIRFDEMVSVIFTLAEELGVSNVVLDQGRAISDLVQQEDWFAVRRALDGLHDSIESELQAMGDDDTALLMAAAAWLEGLRAVSHILDRNYDPELSTILYQTGLVRHFQEKFQTLCPEAKAHPLVERLSKALPDILALIDVGPGNPVPEENVHHLFEISTELIRGIENG